MPLKARSAKAKGTKLEKKIADDLEKDCKWKARKQPGRGIYSAFPHDVSALSPTGNEYIFEAKKWKHGWRTGDKAKGKAHFLVIERDFGQPCVYMTWDMFKELCLDIYELHEQLKGSKNNEKDTK